MIEKELNEKQKAKKDRILQESTELFSFKGYDDTTISQIAKAASISFGSVFTYFETKEELFEKVITQPFPDVKEQFSGLTKGNVITAEYIESIVERHIIFFVKNRLYLQLIQQVLGNPERFSDLSEKLNEIAVYMRKEIRELVKLGQKQNLLDLESSEAVATGYISFLIGMRMFMTDSEESSIWMELKPIALKILGL
ncbi:TetR/AcrR family transcriptional regulator [Virgibacillus ndiopensis]|uniref:TetR/AcrR family transcriptional regulator n=1 Tax=Virgibacillus ndiopensis TaxID=2004408 RepID=UPI00159B9E2B|nr:TetR/AcrR family transcriptional regulator [Virgibacillus ndiopensis]